MKLNRVILLAAAVAMLGACGKKPVTPVEAEDGELTLSVSAAEPVHLTKASANPADFAVSIIGTGAIAGMEGTTFEYDKASLLPESIKMPEGTYCVTAHSPGELEDVMAEPYYMASKDVEIIRNTTTSAVLECRMANSRIRLNFSSEFYARYSSWTITVNDGVKTLTYTETSSYDDIYWHIASGTDRINVDIRATTVDGNSVYANNVFMKNNSEEGYTDIENECFTGGDAITVNFTPATDPNGYITGISVTMTVTFENYEESVTLEIKDEGASDEPYEDDPNDPNTPGDDDAITVTFTYGQEFNATLNDTSSAPDVEVKFAIPNGVSHIYVKVDGSDDFNFACNLMGMREGDGMDLAGPGALELASLFALPKTGDTEYTFSLNAALWELLLVTPGYEGDQTFTLKAVDLKGNIKTGSLTLHIAAN